MFESSEIPAQLQEQIVDTAGRLAAAQCSWLLALADLDASGRGDPVEFASTAAWLSWSCAVQTQTAKEYVEAGRRLKQLPKITAEFSEGRLSYSQVRLLVRVASDRTEETLIYLARNSTVGQLGIVVGRYRCLLEAEAATKERRPGRYLHTWFDETGYFTLRGRLCPEDGAIVDTALRQAMESIEETNDALDNQAARQADALVEIAQGSSGNAAQPAHVVVHVDLDSLGGGVGDDCHLESGVVLAPSTALRLACDAALVPIIEDSQGKPLSVGRRTRTIPTGLRRALKSRDKGCRFPGCANHRFVHGHHVSHWARGGHTSIDNLVQLCSTHHRLVHEGGYSVKAAAEGFDFFRTDGSRVPNSLVAQKDHPPEIGKVKDKKAISPDWYGRMDLGYTLGALFEEEPREKETGGPDPPEAATG